jgi:AraC-like DNA-binding protein
MVTHLAALEQFMEVIDREWPTIGIKHFGLWSNRGWDGPARTFELAYYYSGSNTIIHDHDELIHVKAGHLLFLTDTIQTSRSPGGHFKAFYLTLSVDHPEQIIVIRQLFERLSPNSQPLYIPGLEKPFADMLAEFRLNRPTHLFMKYMLLHLLVQTYQFIDKFGITGPTISRLRHKSLVETVIEQLNVGYQDKLRISDLAEEHGMNERYLNQVFKSITGISLGQYLIRIRIEHAKRLLLTTSLTLTDVALETGFYDAAHFCKMFKNVEHQTPAEYKGASQ